MRHAWSEPKAFYAHRGQGSRTLEYCRGCGALRVSLHSRARPLAPVVLLLEVTKERVARLTTDFCAHAAPQDVIDAAAATTEAGSVRWDLLEQITRHTVTQDEWVEACGSARIAHIRTDARRIDRVSYIRPRMIVEVLCGAERKLGQGTVPWTELSHAQNVRGGLHAICIDCVRLVTRRGEWLVAGKTKEIAT